VKDSPQSIPSFADWMEKCLYDSRSGYYTSGRVQFGQADHFWTYPRILSPLFGWAVAEYALAMVAHWSALGLMSRDETFTVLELGAGDGLLARDVLCYLIDRVEEPCRQQHANRIEYVIGEISPALRDRQESMLGDYINEDRAHVLPIDAREISWHGRFKGLVVCNELVDAFPLERIRFDGPGGTPSRVHVRLEELPAASGVAEKLIPLADGWRIRDGSPAEAVPGQLVEYLETVRPLVDDLDVCGLLPVELLWPPALPNFVRGLGELLSGQERLGAALIFDYGGTSRHVVDPRSAVSHLRSGGARGIQPAFTDDCCDHGSRDITGDVDFSELGRLSRAVGLDVPFYGHQSAIEGFLERVPASLCLEALAERLTEHLGFAPGVAAAVAPRVLERFRRAPCFWLMCLSPDGATLPTEKLGASLPFDSKGLHSLKTGIPDEQLRNAFADAGIPTQLSTCLRPCGDIAADLSDARMLEYHAAALELLGARGWLAPPGSIRDFWRTSCS